MAFLWSKGTLEQKATQLVRVVHGGDGKKPVVGARMLVDEFDILFSLATDFIIEEAIKSNNSDLKLDIKQLEANEILQAKINNGGKRFEQAKKVLILGQPEDEDEDFTGFINLLFGTKSQLDDEEVVTILKSDHQLRWIFSPAAIRERMINLLNSENLDQIPLTEDL